MSQHASMCKHLGVRRSGRAERRLCTPLSHRLQFFTLDISCTMRPCCPPPARSVTAALPSAAGATRGSGEPASEAEPAGEPFSAATLLFRAPLPSRPHTAPYLMLLGPASAAAAATSVAAGSSADAAKRDSLSVLLQVQGLAASPVSTSAAAASDLPLCLRFLPFEAVLVLALRLHRRTCKREHCRPYLCCCRGNWFIGSSSSSPALFEPPRHPPGWR